MTRQQRWQQFMDWPLTAAALIFLIAYSWEVIGDLDGPRAVVAESIIWATWAVFVLDYIVNLALATRRWHWFTRHIFDLLVVVLPMLRPLRMLRLVTILAVLQRSTGGAFRGRVVVYAAGASLLLVYVAALAALDAERDHGSIQTLGQGLWWAFVTITTVGYGDVYPVTPTGQLVAVGVMVAGIALIGVVTATLASWIVEKVSVQQEVEEAITRAHVETLTEEIRKLRELVSSRL
ncbi:potassium channel family protein [Agromyces aureus]|nr:potassium channel family protein [Agromyces aureus]